MDFITSNNRKYAFLFGCIPIRLLLALTPLYLSNNMSFLLGLLLLLPTFGFLFLYFTHSRLHSYESGGNTWWAPYRIYHGLLYLFAAICLLNAKNRYASILLLTDVLFGLTLWLVNKRNV